MSRKFIIAYIDIINITLTFRLAIRNRIMLKKYHDQVRWKKKHEKRYSALFPPKYGNFFAQGLEVSQQRPSNAIKI